MNIINNLVQAFILISDHSSETGFGINTNIFETNVINIGILLGIVVYVGKPFLTSTLQTRQDKVLASIQEAEEKLQQANTRLAESEKQLMQTQMVIDNIKQEAEATADKVRNSILEQGANDIERLAATGKASIATAEVQIRKQIQQQIATLALKRVLLQLKGEMNPETQSKIIDSNIKQLGGQL
uniref:ATP synthase CFO B subunit subunit I n=1 Tax=Pseudoerythrocladia kornmannii TaxID=753682 RepID=UPI001FCCC626|nr:ATP synthase CFO B subunit subunit I [Pseudoerythrocladia kornmannii]UNJ16738.1 ATP synthase CFO B subunit subunit I [Pseudoerythrocladia kornmannii]